VARLRRSLAPLPIGLSIIVDILVAVYVGAPAVVGMSSFWIGYCSNYGDAPLRDSCEAFSRVFTVVVWVALVAGLLLR